MSLKARLEAFASEVGADVKELQDILATYAGGSVQDYATRSTTFTTTNTTIGSVAASAIISGLEVSVVGTGRPVDLNFLVPFRHSAANSYVGVYLITSVDGGADSADTFKRAAIGSVAGSTQAHNRTLAPTLPPVPTVEGSQYTFKLGAYGPTGTTTMETLGYDMCLVARNH